MISALTESASLASLPRRLQEVEIAEVIEALEVEVPPQVTNALGVVAQVTGPRIVQTDVVAVTAETEQDLKVAASNVANEATSSAIAEVVVAADLAAATLAEATTHTILAAVMTAAEAPLAATTDATIAAATLLTASEEETAAAVPLVVADLLPVTTETEA